MIILYALKDFFVFQADIRLKSLNKLDETDNEYQNDIKNDTSVSFRTQEVYIFCQLMQDFFSSQNLSFLTQNRLTLKKIMGVCLQLVNINT